MKTIFLGTPGFAIPSLEALLKTSWIELLAVGTQTDKEAGRKMNISEPPVKKLAREKGIEVIQSRKVSKEPDVIQRIKNLKPDVIVSCAYGQILNDEILNIAPHGVINVHASLLPKYRGAAPINWAILNGEEECGITIMKTELGLDSGPVILQKICKIGENETSVELSGKLSLLGAEALIKALELIRDRKAKLTPQDETKATKAPMLKKDLGLINWNDSAKNIHNKIRGLQPWPSAFMHFQGKRIKIWEGRGVACNALQTVDRNIMPGTIVEIGDFVKVKTKDGYLDIYKIQPESKKIISTKDWINGFRVKIGDKFE